MVNALADNLPQGRFLGIPRYNDGAVRPLVAWLGIGAVLAHLRRPPQKGGDGKGQKLSWRYPLTELILTAVLLLTYLVADAQALVPLGQQVLWHSYAVVFVLLAIVDIEHKRILFRPVLVISVLALIDAAVYPQYAPDMPSSLAGGVVGGLVFSLVYAGGLVFGRVFGRGLKLTTAFGKGDIYLMAMGGLVVGFPHVLAAMIAAIFLGGFGALVYILGLRLLGRRYERFTALAYGPYILAATYVVMLFPSATSLGI